MNAEPNYCKNCGATIDFSQSSSGKCSFCGSHATLKGGSVPPVSATQFWQAATQGNTLRPHRAGMVLGFGITGLVLSGPGGLLGAFCCLVCFIPAIGLVFGILAWVFGNADLRAMADGQMDRSGEGTTRTGMIMGIISVCLAVLFAAIPIALAFINGVAN